MYCVDFVEGKCDNCGDCWVYEIDDTYEKAKEEIYDDVLKMEE